MPVRLVLSGGHTVNKTLTITIANVLGSTIIEARFTIIEVAIDDCKNENEFRICVN